MLNTTQTLTLNRLREVLTDALRPAIELYPDLCNDNSPWTPSRGDMDVILPFLAMPFRDVKLFPGTLTFTVFNLNKDDLNSPITHFRIWLNGNYHGEVVTELLTGMLRALAMFLSPAGQQRFSEAQLNGLEKILTGHRFRYSEQAEAINTEMTQRIAALPDPDTTRQVTENWAMRVGDWLNTNFREVAEPHTAGLPLEKRDWCFEWAGRGGVQPREAELNVTVVTKWGTQFCFSSHEVQRIAYAVCPPLVEGELTKPEDVILSLLDHWKPIGPAKETFFEPVTSAFLDTAGNERLKTHQTHENNNRAIAELVNLLDGTPVRHIDPDAVQYQVWEMNSVELVGFGRNLEKLLVMLGARGAVDVGVVSAGTPDHSPGKMRFIGTIEAKVSGGAAIAFDLPRFQWFMKVFNRFEQRLEGGTYGQG